MRGSQISMGEGRLRRLLNRRRPMEWLFVILVPIWLFGLNFPAMMVDTDQLELIQIASLVWILPPLLFSGTNLFTYGPILRASAPVRICLVLLLTAIAISAALSMDPIRSAGYVVTTTIGLWMSAGLWSCISKQLERALAWYGILWSIFSIYVYFVDERKIGRLTFGLA